MCDEALVQGPEQNSSSKTLAVTQVPRADSGKPNVPSAFFLLPLARSLSVSLEATTGPTRPTGGVQRRPKLRAVP